MLGRLRWGSGRKIQVRPECLMEVPMLTLELPERARSPERALKRCVDLLKSHQVNRVLTPPRFPGWATLQKNGIRPVETRMLRCALAPVWVVNSLEAKGVATERACVCLRGDRISAEMSQVAHSLCPKVRNLVIDAPGGAVLGKNLRAEYGLPVLLSERECDFVLQFDSGPILSGAKISLKGRDIPDECENFPLISILWETGRVKTEEILLQV